MQAIATKLLTTLAEKGNYIFTFEQVATIAEELSLNKIQLKRLLAKLGIQPHIRTKMAIAFITS